MTTRNSPAASSCADPESPGTLRVAEARQRICQRVGRISGRETLALRSALGRVLYKPVVSGIDVPLHANSAMDGYALRGKDLPTSGVKTLEIVGSLVAGGRFEGAVGQDQCIRIMTGAPLPAGTDTVVMQEQAEATDDRILIDAGHRPGQNVRLAGEDLRNGETVLEKGRQLTPADMGIIASLGVPEVEVYRLPRVTFFSTGDELRSLGEVLVPGDVYDSNRYSLHGMLTRSGVQLRDMGVVRDDAAAMREALQDAASNSDIVITSGGVSVGDADYVKRVLTEIGEMSFWKIAMKPGRPLTFGEIGGAFMFGLPGNPVAVMVTYYQFVQPALQYFMGMSDNSPIRVRARSTEAIRKRSGRTEFIRGVLKNDAAGGLVVRRTGQQGSGVLRSMSLANCFIVLPEDNDGVAAGDEVSVEPFAGLI